MKTIKELEQEFFRPELETILLRTRDENNYITIKDFANILKQILDEAEIEALIKNLK